MNRFHIVGLNPRTGTTLLAECMRLCFRIDRAEEHEAGLHRLRYCRGIYLTKRPRDVEAVGLRLRLDPRLRVICLARDPRDVVVSRHGADAHSYYDKTSLLRFRQRWAAAKALLDHPNFMIVRFEDLISNPDRVQEQIATRFPFLERKAAFSTFHQQGSVSHKSQLALNGVRPIDPTNTAKWPEHLERIAAQMQQSGSISDELRDLGYEADDAWMARHSLSRPPVRPISARKLRGSRAVALVVTAVLCAGMARLGLPIG